MVIVQHMLHQGYNVTGEAIKAVQQETFVAAVNELLPNALNSTTLQQDALQLLDFTKLDSINALR